MHHLWTALLGTIALAWVITAIRAWRGDVRAAKAQEKERAWEHLNLLPHLELVGFWEKTVLSFWALSSIVWLEPWRVSNPRSRRYFGFGALQALRRTGSAAEKMRRTRSHAVPGWGTIRG